MHRTWVGLNVLTSPNRQGSSSATSGSSRFTPPTVTPNANPSLAAGRTRSRQSGSTVWGPGALGGKLMKHIGESVLAGAEYLVIHRRLSQITELQPQILSSPYPPNDAESIQQIENQCKDLVELSIMEMGYPLKIMTQAFSLILRGFKLPGRHLWTYYIAEAMCQRHLQNIFEIFLHGFFPLLDDSVFRLEGIVDLETLRYRCPMVAREVTTIISHLSRRDQMVEPLYVPPVSSNKELSRVVSATSPLLSTMIIRAQFFRLVRDWEARGFPHWDNSGKEMLEQALQDVADAQHFRDDPEGSAVEALELKEKIRDQRYISLPEFERTDSLAKIVSGDR